MKSKRHRREPHEPNPHRRGLARQRVQSLRTPQPQRGRARAAGGDRRRPGPYGRMVASAEGSMTQLQRLIITFKPEETIMHALYRTQDGPGPNTKARKREVEQLVRIGLHQALVSLKDGAEVVGTSGFSTREDILSLARPDHARKAAS